MAYENDILTRNDDDELSVRVVQSTGDNPAVAYDDIYTRDDNGKLAVRVVGAGGGGGGDVHNLGWYATPQALTEAHPTATAGDWAIVGSTDTVWLWDTDDSQWVDSDTKGQVTSVNNQTGAVTVQETLVSGTNIKTVDGNSLLGSGNLELSTYLPFPNTWTTTGTTKALCDDIAADTTVTKGKAYLGEVTCSDLPASIANGEIVVEIMDGTTAANKVIVLTLTSGNTAPYMWKYTYWNGGTDVSGWQTWATSAQGAKADTAVQPGDLATVATSGAYSDLTGTPTIPAAIQVSTMPTAAVGELGKVYQFIGATDANYTHGYFYECVSDGGNPATYSWTQTDVQPQAGGLPSQTGQSGKFLTTDGTDASWATINALQNTATGTDSITILGSATAKEGAVNIGVGSAVTGYNNGVAIGKNATAIGGISVGYGATTNAQYGTGIAIGKSSTCSLYGVALGDTATSTGQGATVIGTGRSSSTAEGAIAIGAGVRATATGAIQIGYGDTGAVNANKPTNNEQYTLYVGYYKSSQVVNYKLLDSDGTIPTDRFTTTPVADGTYVPTLTISSGVATRTWGAAPSGGLPSQTGNSGKFLTTNGTDASWATINALQNVATGTDSISILGPVATANYCINMGLYSGAKQAGCTAIGIAANAGGTTGSDVNASAYGMYSSATKAASVAVGYQAVANASGSAQIGTGTNSTANTLQFKSYSLVSSDGTIPHARLTNSVVSNSISIAVADWNGGTTCTKTVSGLTATSVVWVAPDNASQSDYLTAGVYASAQTTDTITFTCSTTPTSALTVNVIYC